MWRIIPYSEIEYNKSEYSYFKAQRSRVRIPFKRCGWPDTDNLLILAGEVEQRWILRGIFTEQIIEATEFSDSFILCNWGLDKEKLWTLI